MNNTSQLAPIVLFAYNRLWHTQQTVHALANNELAAGSKLFIFSDGPKNDADRKKVEDVRKYLKTISGFLSVEVNESIRNNGLSNSVISGVSMILKEFPSAIVLEDDMTTSPFFLSYMNNALQIYAEVEKVVSIHGYVYPVGERLPETFFLRGADCWGWGTWRRGWDLFQADGRSLLARLKAENLCYEFDFSKSYPFTRMLEQQVRGQIDSWAIRWYASTFLDGKLTLYPGKSLVKNIGNDASGTHSWDNDRFDHTELARTIDVRQIRLEESAEAKRIISKYLKATNPSVIKRVLNKVRFYLRTK